MNSDGKLAAFRRVPTGKDPRANISTGGRSVPLQIGDVECGIVEAMSKKLVADGMFFVGIDVIGDKVVEINADSPGGMQSVEWLYEIDVCPTVIEALETPHRLEVLSHSAIGSCIRLHLSSGLPLVHSVAPPNAPCSPREMYPTRTPPFRRIWFRRRPGCEPTRRRRRVKRGDKRAASPAGSG